MYGRGIGSFFKDITTNKGFKNTIKDIGRYSADLGMRGIKTLAPIALNAGMNAFSNGKFDESSLTHLGKDLGSAGADFAGKEASSAAGKATNKLLTKLDKKIGKENADLLLSGAKTGLQAASDAGIVDKVYRGVDKKLNLPGRITKPARDIGDLVKDSVSNATDSRGRVIPNISEVIKDPKVIKAIGNRVFEPKADPGEKTREPDILSNLLAGAGSKRPRKTKAKTGDGLFLPGRKTGQGLRVPGRGLSGSGIAYV
jgi:hypothetical protein